MTHADAAPAPEHRAAQTDAVVFFEDTARAFARAAQVTSPRELLLRIAGLPVRLLFAGDAMFEKLTRALEHHAAPTADAPPDTAPPAELTIRLWDGASTGNHLPRLAFQGAMVTRRGEVKKFPRGRIELALDRSADTLSLYDHERALALFCTRDARRLPDYERAAPLKTILYWGLRRRERFFVHAGAVGNPTGAALLAGKGGSGKTTSTLACVAAGMLYLGDDYCLIRAQPQPFVYNVYNTAKVTPATLERVPRLRAVAASGLRVGEKTVLFLDTWQPDKIAPGLPLKVILLPRVTGRAAPRLVPTTAHAALSALAISTLVQLPDAGSENLRALEQLVNQLPCYVLELGEADEVPQLVEQLLAEHR
jgi:hypothetical protein